MFFGGDTVYIHCKIQVWYINLYTITHCSWSCRRKCKWVFISEHSVV